MIEEVEGFNTELRVQTFVDARLFDIAISYRQSPGPMTAPRCSVPPKVCGAVGAANAAVLKNVFQVFGPLLGLPTWLGRVLDGRPLFGDPSTFSPEAEGSPKGPVRPAKTVNGSPLFTVMIPVACQPSKKVSRYSHLVDEEG